MKTTVKKKKPAAASKQSKPKTKTVEKKPVRGSKNVARDAGQRGKKKDALKQSEQTTRGLLNAYTDSAFLLDADGVILVANETFAKRMGTSMKEIIGKNAFDFLPPDLSQTRREKIKKVVRTGAPLHFMDERGGMFLENSIYPIKDGYDKVVRLAVYSRDVTERNKMEDALRRAHDQLEIRVQERTAELTKTNEALQADIGVRIQAEQAIRGVEDSLKEKQYFLDKVLNTTPNLIYIYDLIEHRNVYANRETLEYLGYDLERIKSEGDAILANVIHPDDLARIREHHKRFVTANDGDVFEIEYRLKDANENWRWMRSRDALFARDSQGNPRQIIGIAEDITERKQAEAALRESEERFKNLSNMTTEGIMIHDNGLILDINQTFADLWGYHSSDDLIGKNAFELMAVTPESRQAIMDHMKSGSADVYEIIGIRLDGSLFPGETQGREIIYRGNPARVVLLRDITERKRVEEALRENEARFSTIFHASPARISITRLQDGIFLDVNESFLSSTGYRREEVVGHTLDNWVNPEDAGRLRWQLTEQGAIRGFETQLLQKSGQIRNVLMSADIVELFGENCILSIGVDITERKHAEEALQNKETQIRTLSDNLPNGYMYQLDFGLHGETRRFNYISAGVEKLHGITVQQVLDNPLILYRQMLKEDRAMATEKEAAAFASMTTFQVEARYRSSSGQIQWMLLRSTPHKSSNQHIVWDGVALDITEHKLVEEALRESESKFRLLFENMQEGFSLHEMILDENGRALDFRFLDANKAYEDHTGFKPQNVIGKSMREILPEVDPRQIENYGKVALSGEPQIFEYYSKAFDKHFRVRTFSPKRGQFATIFEDITMRKQAEEQSRASLREKETLLKEIHHRVKNNLQVISSLLYLQSRTSTDENIRTMFLESQNRITSMALIHEKLYQSADLARIAFTDYARDLAHSLLHAYGMDHSRVALFVEAGELALDIDNAVPCGLIINEIVSNSLKYAFPDHRHGNIRIALELESGGRFKLTLSDDGAGLPADYETRSAGSLGTKLIERLSEQIHGTLERSSSDQGTRYVISFPREKESG